MAYREIDLERVNPIERISEGLKEPLHHDPWLRLHSGRPLVAEFGVASRRWSSCIGVEAAAGAFACESEHHRAPSLSTRSLPLWTTSGSDSRRLSLGGGGLHKAPAPHRRVGGLSRVL